MNEALENSVSVIIKTFNRKKSLEKLLCSLQNLRYPGPVLLADDSAIPYAGQMSARFPLLDLHAFTMPFDSGLSAGRNLLLRKANTPYILLCDDDFVFDNRFDIKSVLRDLKSHQLDIAGGALCNYITPSGPYGLAGIFAKPWKAIRYLTGSPVTSRYAGHFSEKDGECRLLISNQEPVNAVYRCDVVNNFFLASKESLLQIGGWDENFKVGEHEDFFYRAKLSGLRVGLVSSLVAKHFPGARKEYLRFRERSYNLKKQFPAKFHFSIYQEIDMDNNKLLFDWSALHEKKTRSFTASFL